MPLTFAAHAARARFVRSLWRSLDVRLVALLVACPLLALACGARSNLLGLEANDASLPDAVANDAQPPEEAQADVSVPRVPHPRIASSLTNTCAIDASGGVECWGDNSWGGAGNGSDAGTFNTPQPVTGLTHGIMSISSGDGSYCAVSTMGTVSCWGINLYGQLGNGTTVEDASSPVAVVGVTTAVGASGGILVNCVLLLSGAVECMGSNFHDGLALGTWSEDERRQNDARHHDGERRIRIRWVSVRVCGDARRCCGVCRLELRRSARRPWVELGVLRHVAHGDREWRRRGGVRG